MTQFYKFEFKSVNQYKDREPSRETQNPLNPTAVSPPCSRLPDLPSPLCEGDCDQRWSDQGCIALFLFLSLSPFIFLFFFLLAPRLDGSESPIIS